MRKCHLPSDQLLITNIATFVLNKVKVENSLLTEYISQHHARYSSRPLHNKALSPRVGVEVIAHTLNDPNNSFLYCS